MPHTEWVEVRGQEAHGGCRLESLLWAPLCIWLYYIVLNKRKTWDIYYIYLYLQ